MNQNWISLEVFADSSKHEIISSYFEDITLGNQFLDNQVTLYFSKDLKVFANSILDKIHKKYDVKFNWKEVKYKNWMNNWKHNFKPVNIKDTVLIVPDWDDDSYNFLYKIKINPAMAFGTGHHESTQLMIENMLEYDIGSYHKVIDLGCGSGVLSILASKMGCDNIIAIDNDSICEDNFLENCQLNSANNIKFYIEDVHKWDSYDCDIILANINKNNILKIIDKFEKSSSKSILIVSGLLNSDLDQILERLSISFVENIKKRNNWISLVIKNK